MMQPVSETVKGIKRGGVGLVPYSGFVLPKHQRLFLVKNEKGNLRLEKCTTVEQKANTAYDNNFNSQGKQKSPKLQTSHKQDQQAY